MSSNTLIGTAALCLLLGGGAGWFLRGAPEPEGGGSVDDAASSDSTRAGALTLSADADFARKRIATLEQELEGLKRERESLRDELTQVKSGATMAPDEASRIAAAAKLKAPRYTYEGITKALLEMDWEKISTSVVGMAEPMQALGEALAAGRPAGDLVQKVQKYNMPLIQAALEANQGGLKGSGINGSFTHPAMVVNMVYSTLVAAGQPLDESQTEKLSQLGDRFVSDDARRRAGVGDDAWAMESLVQESEMKDRLYKGIDAMLTPEQLAVLHPPALRDRTAGDIFSAGLIWMQNAQVLQGTGRDEIAASLSGVLMARLQVPVEEKDTVDRAVADWLGKFGDNTLVPLDELEKNNMVRMDRIRAAGRPMVALYKELGRNLQSLPGLMERARAGALLVIPAKKP